VTLRRVWAPNAQRVDLLLNDRRVPLTAADGWYETDLHDADATADYRYSLDGGPPRADPRSPFQPEGVDGPSRPVDHAAFAWRDATWRPPPLASSVLYELHVGTFTPAGTFDGVLTKVDHLLGTGVTAIELMPVAEFPGRRGWGYDGVFPYAPHHSYGGPDGLKRLVDGCHARGLAVLIDVVYNHLGPSGNVLPEFGPYLTDRYRTPWGDAINLDGAGSDEVRRYFIDNALMWLRDYHVDGLRLDAVHAILDTGAFHFLEQLSVEVEELAGHVGRPLWLIAESDANDPRLVRRREVGGYGLDAQWDDDFHHAIHALLTGERDGYYEDFGSVADLAECLRERFVYRGRRSAYRQRRHGRPAPDVAGTRFVGYSQNHDQVGNRACGERSSALMSPARLGIAAAVVCCAPFVPLLFEGEEWGATTPFQYFTDHDDPGVGHAVTEGRRTEFAAFGWDPEKVPDPQDEGTWMASRLRWEEVRETEHAELLDWYRGLLALRRSEPALTDGRCDLVEVVHDERGWFRFRRGPITVVANATGGAQTVSAESPGTAVLVWPRDQVVVGGATVRFEGDGVAIVRS
jgi:maltooligosyltrehalose trehalohydrolase